MKPLPVASYTEEDWNLMREATVRWMVRHHGPFPLASIYVHADRSDAERMLAWQRFRILSWNSALHEPSLLWLRDPSEPRWQPVGGQL
jgi:hypothetical protein